MSRVHDMGGRFGDGPVNPEDNATFAKPWHARALALTLAAGSLGKWNIDISRHAREKLRPKDYARFSYYEKWISALADLLVERGVLSVEELEQGKAIGHSSLADKKLTPENVAPTLAKGGPSERPATSAPAFKIGDRVRTRHHAENSEIAGGHTRLPHYAAGVVGEIVLLHGTHVLPDSNAHDHGEAPEPLYAVAFDAATLWGKAEGDGDEVILDLWQSYLSPA